MRDNVKEFLGILESQGYSVMASNEDPEKAVINFPLLYDSIALDFTGKDPDTKDYVRIINFVQGVREKKLRVIIEALRKQVKEDAVEVDSDGEGVCPVEVSGFYGEEDGVTNNAE